MTCDESRLLLHAYLDDELDAAQSVEMERHVAACPACAAAQQQKHEHPAASEDDKQRLV